ncbi:hypothetical protein BTI92_03985 [Lactobacillus delbrueckii subsp. bulgaricus]|nr:hypothetical protein [Lactobacillus delbrueckii subsp. bulgaricus]TXJ89413.1 DUF1919 domain-containing protein [Lactobacillus delbrueckii]
MPTYEGLRLKVLKFRREKFAAKRKQNLIDTKFTIISNNCWGGMLYESYDLPKESPTVGLFIMADDYIKFLKDLKGYLDSELTFIDPKSSKWYSQVSVDKRYGNYPVGKLKDVEIFFLHYHSEEEAMAKWHRRIKRINWDRLLVKFNDQNGCTRKDVEEFLKLPFKHKIFFTCKNWNVADPQHVIVKINQFPKHNFIMASYEPFGKNKYINLDKLINSLGK